MSRIVFDLPEKFVFSTEMQIYISHVNQSGHLDNARLRFFRWLGYTEADVDALAAA